MEKIDKKVLKYTLFFALNSLLPNELVTLERNIPTVKKTRTRAPAPLCVPF